MIIVGSFPHFLKRDKTSFSSMSKSLCLTCFSGVPSVLSAASQSSFTAAWQRGMGWNRDLHTLARTLETPVLQDTDGAAPGATAQSGAKVGWYTAGDSHLCGSNPKCFWRLCLNLGKWWMLEQCIPWDVTWSNPAGGLRLLALGWAGNSLNHSDKLLRLFTVIKLKLWYKSLLCNRICQQLRTGDTVGPIAKKILHAKGDTRGVVHHPSSQCQGETRLFHCSAS